MFNCIISIGSQDLRLQLTVESHHPVPQWLVGENGDTKRLGHNLQIPPKEL